MKQYGKPLCLLALAAACLAGNAWRQTAAGQAGDAQIQRGDYLVNKIGQCAECHTPRDDKGNLDSTKHLQGGPLWFTSKIKFKKWETKVPDITSSGIATKWSEERLVKFLSTGEKADMPMPAYNMSVEDAKAVTAYLRSLPGKKKS
jgi:mono/diheme cytochrome c family protein